MGKGALGKKSVFYLKMMKNMEKIQFSSKFDNVDFQKKFNNLLF